MEKNEDILRKFSKAISNLQQIQLHRRFSVDLV